MSSQKTTQRRLSLLAGSSLAAATIAATAFAGAALAPTAAFAANECTPVGVDPAANGPAPDSFACTATTYATGITYNSNGNLTVSTTSTGTTTVTANGVNLTGNGTDSVTWDSSAGTLAGGTGTAGPVIDVTTNTGDITITTAGVTATQAGVTHAIRATSTGGGDITITRSTGTVSANNATTGDTAIEAVTNGGDIEIVAMGTTNGRVRSILAQTSGSGSVDVTVGGGNVNANSPTAIANIDVVTGTGGANVLVTSNAVNGAPGAAIRIVSPVSATVRNAGGTVNGRVDFSGVAGGVVFENEGASSTAGRWTATGASVFSSGNDRLALSGAGSNSLAAGASIDFGGGADVMTVGGELTLQAGSLIAFGAGADTLSVSGRLVTNAATLDFGTGADTFNLSGVWAMDGVTLQNLEAFNHSGVILMGPQRSGQQNLPDYVNTDGHTNDALVLSQGTFTGSNGGRVVMDVFVGTQEQAGCATLTAADCLDLRGASTAGTTLLTINNISGAANLGAFNPAGITLVDVGGAGTSAAGHFALDPNSEGYVEDPFLGGAIDRPGLFRYALRYDAVNQRHVLVGLPNAGVMEYAMLSGAAQSIWHLTAQTVTERQTDLRERPEGGSLWLRAAGEYTKRTSASAFDAVGETFSVDTGHKLYAGTIMGGMDLITGHSDGYDYVAGVQIGYVASSFDLNASETSGRFSGATGGVYGSIWTDRMFLDGTFNMNGLTLDYDSPGLDSKTNTYTTAFGARLDGGLRWALMPNLVAEPLATLAFARTAFEEISLSGGEIRPADAQSKRGALGLRLAGTLGGGESLGATYFVTGRAWHELDGETDGVVNNPGADLVFHDEFSGGFGEAEAGINLFNPARTLSGYLASGVKFKDGYSAVDLSLGLRMAW